MRRVSTKATEAGNAVTARSGVRNTNPSPVTIASPIVRGPSPGERTIEDTAALEALIPQYAERGERELKAAQEAMRAIAQGATPFDTVIAIDISTTEGVLLYSIYAIVHLRGVGVCEVEADGDREVAGVPRRSLSRLTRTVWAWSGVMRRRSVR